MGWITDTWRAAVDGARTWGREASAEWRDTVREITGPAGADRWAAERARQAAAGPTWLARDGERVVEVDADGYPGREADPGDGRPVADPAGLYEGHPVEDPHRPDDWPAGWDMRTWDRSQAGWWEQAGLDHPGDGAAGRERFARFEASEHGREAGA